MCVVCVVCMCVCVCVRGGGTTSLKQASCLTLSLCHTHTNTHTHTVKISHQLDAQLLQVKTLLALNQHPWRLQGGPVPSEVLWLRCCALLATRRRCLQAFVLSAWATRQLR